jgi:hypothetical protein
MHCGGKQARAPVGVTEGSFHQPPADAASLVARQHAVGGEVPEILAILRDREPDDGAVARRNPASARIRFEAEPHALDPLVRLSRRARFGLWLAHCSAPSVRFEKNLFRGTFG